MRTFRSSSAFGGKILPAGSYEVRTQFAPDILVLQCFKCNASALTLTTSAYARETPKTGALVFNRYNGTYVLSSIWKAGEAGGRAVPESKAEREWARNHSLTPARVALASR